MTQPVLEPEVDGNPSNGAGGNRWMVTIFNNDTNSFDEVIGILMRATGCDMEEAAIEAWEAHHYGKAPVHFAGQKECTEIAVLISSIGVQTEVEPEWQD
jgi:ATP-dependent Clp protease adaptor protein ClpS